MSVQEVLPEIGPHTTHLHLLGNLPAPSPDEVYLRDDQRAALEIVSFEAENPRTPETVVLVTDEGEQEFTIANIFVNAHTRWGKFELAMAHFNRFKNDNPDARGLYLAHTQGLIRDGREKFERRFEDRYLAGEYSGKRKDEGDFDMLFGTFQSIAKADFPRRHFLWKAVDEGHHSNAPTYERVIRHFVPDIRFGITATPNRLDQLDPRRIYGPEVIDVPLAEGIVRGTLRQMTYKVMLEDNIRRRLEQSKLDTSVLNRETARIEPNLKEMIARGQREIKEAGIEDPITVHFAQSIQQAEDIASILAEQGKTTSVIHSQQTDEQNDEATRQLREGEVDDIISINMLNEGRDIPNVNVIAFYRSTESENIFIQQLGRGLQPAEDGSPLLVLDYVANAKRLEFIANIMHGITDYALDAEEYKQKSQTEPEDKGYHQPDWVNVPRSVGADFQLDEELLKVIESVEEQQNYMERLKAMEQIDEFDALAYVNVLARNTRGYPNKTRIADRHKRGLGPSYRSIVAASGLELDQILENVDKDRSFFEDIGHTFNHLQLPDVIILLVQDILLRHPDVNKVVDRNVFSRPGTDDTYHMLESSLTLPDGLSVSMSHYTDMVIIEIDGVSYYITPTRADRTRFDWQEKYNLVDGWDIEINSDQEIKGQFVRGDKPIDMDNLIVLIDLFSRLVRTRSGLDQDGVTSPNYPFYAARDISDVSQVLDRFDPENLMETWDDYKEKRKQLERIAPLVNKMRQVIKIKGRGGAGPRQKNSIFVGKHNGEDIMFDPGEGVFVGRSGGEDIFFYQDKIVRVLTEDGGEVITMTHRFDIETGNITTYSSHGDRLIDQEHPITDNDRRNIERYTINSAYEEAIVKQLSDPSKFRRPYKFRTPNPEEAEVWEQDRIRDGEEWLASFKERFQEGWHKYVPDERIIDTHTTADSLIGSFVTIKKVGTYHKEKNWSGVVIGVDYVSGEIIIANPVYPPGRAEKLSQERVKIFGWSTSSNPLQKITELRVY
ncbi:DEAD/DEAH box helicase family protein [Candidatus Saccharibacteria bacterium]|nr:DEAD/DEAH box helicase family protein [Candidatus Saccharibacteria bacterium]